MRVRTLGPLGGGARMKPGSEVRIIRMTRGDQAPDAKNTIKVLHKAMAILRCFSPREPMLTAWEIAGQLGMNKTTVHRILAELERVRMVFKDLRTRQYTLGVGVRELAWSGLWRHELKTLALGPMRELRDVTQEAVALYVRSNLVEFECILRVESPRALRAYERVGDPLSLGWGAVSSVFYAFELAEFGRESLSRLLRATLAAEVPQPEERLMARIEQVLQQGVAYADRERFADAAAVAAPINDAAGRGLAALSVMGHHHRMDAHRRGLFAPLVKAAAGRISQQLYTTGARPAHSASPAARTTPTQSGTSDWDAVAQSRPGPAEVWQK